MAALSVADLVLPVLSVLLVLSGLSGLSVLSVVLLAVLLAVVGWPSPVHGKAVVFSSGGGGHAPGRGPERSRDWALLGSRCPLHIGDVRLGVSHGVPSHEVPSLGASSADSSGGDSGDIGDSGDVDGSPRDTDSSPAPFPSRSAKKMEEEPDGPDRNSSGAAWVGGNGVSGSGIGAPPSVLSVLGVLGALGVLGVRGTITTPPARPIRKRGLFAVAPCGGTVGVPAGEGLRLPVRCWRCRGENPLLPASSVGT